MLLPGKRTPLVSTTATSASTPINQRMSYSSRLAWQPPPPSTGKSIGTPVATPGTASGALALSVPSSPASESAKRAEAVLKMVEVSVQDQDGSIGCGTAMMEVGQPCVSTHVLLLSSSPLHCCSGLTLRECTAARDCCSAPQQPLPTSRCVSTRRRRRQQEKEPADSGGGAPHITLALCIPHTPLCSQGDPSRDIRPGAGAAGRYLQATCGSCLTACWWGPCLHPQPNNRRCPCIGCPLTGQCPLSSIQLFTGRCWCRSRAIRCTTCQGVRNTSSLFLLPATRRSTTAGPCCGQGRHGCSTCCHSQAISTPQ